MKTLHFIFLKKLDKLNKGGDREFIYKKYGLKMFFKKRIRPEIEKKGTPDPNLRTVKLDSDDGNLISLAVGFGSGLYSGSLSASEAMRMYTKCGAVATAVDIISQEIESIRPVIRDESGNYKNTHPVLDLLRNPNDRHETYSSFIGQLSRDWLLTHTCFGYAGGVLSSEPIEIFSVNPMNVQAEEDGMSGYAGRISATDCTGQGEYLWKNINKNLGFRFLANNIKELWPMFGYSSVNKKIHPDSPLKAVALDIYQHISGRIHNVSMLSNGARPSMVVIFKESGMPRNLLQQRGQDLAMQLSGASNAGKIAVTAGQDLDIKELSKNNKDMDYKNLETIAERAVYNRFRVPLPLVTNDASTFANMGNAIKYLYNFAVLPIATEIFENLSMWLLPRFKEDPSKKQICYDPYSIPAIQEDLLDQLEKRKNLGIETINEMRESLPNRESITGGNDLYINSNQIPLGETQKNDSINPKQDDENMDM